MSDQFWVVNRVGFAILVLAVGSACLAADAMAADTQTTLKQGDPIGAFYVTKAGGAVEDGVENGEELCYRCRYGSSPIVMIFARETGGQVGDLIKKLDAAVASNQDHRLRGLLTLLGEDAGALKTRASELANQTSVQQVPIAIAKESHTGPANYKLSPQVPVTVVLANDSQVVATHLLDSDQIDVAALMKEIQQMLN